MKKETRTQFEWDITFGSLRGIWLCSSIQTILRCKKAKQAAFFSTLGLGFLSDGMFTSTVSHHVFMNNYFTSFHLLFESFKSF